MSAYALLGAGEFEEWHADVDGSLLDGRSGPVLVFATASAPEGEDVYQGWVDKGLAHYADAGIEAVAPGLRTREDANDPAIVSQVEEEYFEPLSATERKTLTSLLARLAGHHDPRYRANR